jgi:hypothetical protein
VSDQSVAVLIGFLVVAGLRVLDWFLPKGRHSKWAEQHSTPDEDEKG